MNRNSTGDVVELDAMFAHDPDLSPEEQQVLANHFLTEIQATDSPVLLTNRKRIRRVAWLSAPVAAAAVAATVFVTVYHVSDTPTASAPGMHVAPAGDAAQLLERIALAAVGKPDVPLHHGQFAYTDTIGWTYLDGPRRQQQWTSVDGSAEGRSVLYVASANGVGWSKKETQPKPAYHGARDWLTPTTMDLQSLPTDPDALLQRIYQVVDASTEPGSTFGFGYNATRDEKAFMAITSLLQNSNVWISPQLSAALYRVAAKLPGLTVVDDGIDGMGRHGVGVAQDWDSSRVEWIFDKTSFAYLGSRQIRTDKPAPKEALYKGVPPGGVMSGDAVVDRDIVDALPPINSIPATLSPSPTPGG